MKKKNMVKDEELNDRIALAADQSVSLNVQTALAKDQDDRVRAALARNPALSPELQTQLANDKAYGVIAALAGNRSLTPKVQEELLQQAQTGNWYDTNNLRTNLAGNPGLIPQVQAAIFRDEFDRTKKTVLAANPALTLELQMAMAESDDYGVMTTLGLNPSLKLRPAIILYFSDNLVAGKVLKASNARLWRQIEKLEQKTLQKHGVGFVRLGDATRQKEVAKKLILDSLKTNDISH